MNTKQTHFLARPVLLVYCFLLLTLSGCAAYHPVAINRVPFKQHSQTQVNDNIRVTVAVLTNQEGEQIFGLDLALRWVQEVWVGSISRDIGVHFTFKPGHFVTHKIDDDVDEVRNSFGEDMLFSQGLQKIGWAKGMPAVPSDKPRINLGGDPYFTDGLLLVLLFHRRPISILEVQFFDWEKPVGRHM
jgi:hypothetical protein